MKTDTHKQGHILALITILVWGTTFISTKVLLRSFTPVEILFFRFLIGYLALWLVYPKVLHIKHKKQEFYFLGAGICGVTLYFLFENIALTYTQATNVGIIVSIAPFFTVIFSRLFLKQQAIHTSFFIGFILAFAGICCISFSGNMTLKLNPIGDILAVLAAIVWAMYSTLTKKIGEFGYSVIPMTRRIFFYGVLCMIPALCFLDFKFDITQFMKIENTANIIFLGLGASAACFVTWNAAVKILGSIKTSVYIYLVPVVTTIFSILILHEKITWIGIVGIVLTLLGLFMSEKRGGKEKIKC